jgi:hypothetical protein
MIECHGQRDVRRHGEEDKAYSMMGIFDIQMPVLYGEGEEKAIRRLRKEVGESSKSLIVANASANKPLRA